LNVVARVGADVQRKSRVLVVDDEPNNLLTFKRVFRLQYDIRLASSGAEALAIIGGMEPDWLDAVLVDFAMPDMNGAAFLEKVRHGHPNLPCIFLTAYAELDEVKAASRRYGVVAVIMKPWEREVVERWVNHSIQIAAMKRSLVRQ
jgi:response regulator RpfG family c-di-GMP phosphodiesterase